MNPGTFIGWAIGTLGAVAIAVLASLAEFDPFWVFVIAFAGGWWLSGVGLRYGTIVWNNNSRAQAYTMIRAGIIDAKHAWAWSYYGNPAKVNEFLGDKYMNMNVSFKNMRLYHAAWIREWDRLVEKEFR